MAKDINDIRPDMSKSMDIRDPNMPTTVCPCGSIVWKVKTVFDQETGEVDMYFLDMECVLCGTLATAPTPIDWEEMD